MMRVLDNKRKQPMTPHQLSMLAFDGFGVFYIAENYTF